MTPATLTALAASFPARMLDHIRTMADRNGTGTHGPHEFSDGTPAQDSAEAAIAWITQAAAILEQIAAADAGVPTAEAARAMGEKGGPVVEGERLAFEAWMAGHCWKVSPTWNGREYDDSAEDKKRKLLDPLARMTRMLWAAWRDRAALTAQSGEGVAMYEALKAAKVATQEAEKLLHKAWAKHGLRVIDDGDGTAVDVAKAADRMDATIDAINAAIAAYEAKRGGAR